MASNARHVTTPVTLPSLPIGEPLLGHARATVIAEIDSDTLSLNTSLLVSTANGAQSNPKTTASENRDPN